MISTDHEIKSIPQDEDSVLGHDAMSLRNWFLTFQKNLVSSSFKGLEFQEKLTLYHRFMVGQIC